MWIVCFVPIATRLMLGWQSSVVAGDTLALKSSVSIPLCCVGGQYIVDVSVMLTSL